MSLPIARISKILTRREITMERTLTKKEKYMIGLAGKYSKELLASLEAYYEVERLPVPVRKFILDSFNDLAREQSQVLTKD